MSSIIPNVTMSSSNSGLNVSSAQSADLASYIAFDTTFNNVVLVLRPIHGSLGVIGSLLLLITLIRNEEFIDPCFICYKGLAVASLFYSMCEILSPIYRIALTFDFPQKQSFQTDYAFSWIRYVGASNGLNMAEQISGYLIAFVSVLRAVACLLPTKFHLINKPRICWAATAIAYVIPISYCLPKAMLEDVRLSAGAYIYWQPSTQGYQTFLAARSWIYMALVPLVLVSCSLAIVGMLKVIWHRRNLKRKVNALPSSELRSGAALENSTHQNREEIKRLKRNLQLCYLQLSQAIPFATFCAMFSQADWWFRAPQFSYSSGGRVDLAYSYTLTYMRQIDLTLESLANDYHFYLILLFSYKFRREFVKRVGKIFGR